MVLTTISDLDGYLVELDDFEDEINDFLEMKGAELVGGIAMVAIGNTIIFTQTLLVEPARPLEVSGSKK